VTLHFVAPQADAERFFSAHPFFTRDEFAAEYTAAGHTVASVNKVLAYHSRAGRIMRLRRGVYCTREVDADPFVCASKLARDAVIAYSGALAFHKLIGIGHSMSLLSAKRAREVVAGDVVHRIIPHALPPGKEHHLTEMHARLGGTVRVTTLSRTLVDCMHRLDHGPGFLETFRAFACKPDLQVNFNEVCEYVGMLGSRVTAARVGACIWAHPTWRQYSADHQFALARMAGPCTLYALPDRAAADTVYLARFRLVVPEALVLAADHPPTDDWSPPPDLN
jgi:predicted transcriptional regulator of viral defense system